MAKFCGTCGTPLVPTAIFCGGCGTKVPAAAPAPAGMPYAPVQAVPPAVAYSPVQPVFTPAPVAPVVNPSGYSPVSPTYDPPPVAPANAWADTSAPVANASAYSPIAPTYDPPPVQPARAWEDAPAPTAPAAQPAEFAPFTSAFDTPPVAPVAEAWTDSPVPSTSVPPTLPPASTPQGFTDVAPVTTQVPVRPAVELGSSTAANQAFNPVGEAPASAQPAFAAYTPVTPPVAPGPIAPAAAAGGYTPVSTGAGPQQPAYTPQQPAYTPQQPAYTPQQPAYTPQQPSYPPPAGAFTAPAAAGAMAGQAYAPVKKSNTLLKVIVAFVLVIFVGSALALAGLWYAAQKIKAKARSVTNQVLSGHPPSTAGGLGGLLSGATTGSDAADSDSENPGGFKGDPCRFLTKEEVSQAAHLTVIRTEASGGGCTYIAKGDPADVTAKHMSALVGNMGGDAKSQQMAQKFAGAFFAQQEAGDKDLRAQAATGEVAVIGIIFTAGHAAAEMKLNRGAFHQVGGTNSASGDLPGVGDEAFQVGGSALMLRKGNTMARIMYTGCPCGTNDVKPLAQLLASRL